MLEDNGSENKGASERLRSLDVLRGFDMFWIIGGKALILALASVLSVDLSEWLGHRMHHPEWDGFEPYDLIFPLFLFIAGVSTIYSIDNRLAKGDSRASLHRHFVQRGLILVLLGVFYNGLLSRDLASTDGWGQMRYASVLGRIGLAYMFAALIASNTQWRAQLIWVVGLLVSYWAALRFYPVPEYGAWDLDPGHTLTDYIDRHLVPGKLYKGDRDPEGLFAVIPAIATALLGCLTGQLLKRNDIDGLKKTRFMAIGGVVCLGLAWLWSMEFPINKNLWSSSFVLNCAGWSLLLLSLFYLVIDVWQFRRGTLFFTVIGSNSILIYMAPSFLDFDYTNESLFGGILSLAGDFKTLLLAVTLLSLKWGLLYYLFRKKIFLKV
jgi:predicted acyltransferase